MTTVHEKDTFQAHKDKTFTASLKNTGLHNFGALHYVVIDLLQQCSLPCGATLDGCIPVSQ